MGRKPLGDRPMTNAEKQAKQREKVHAEKMLLRVALSRICDITGEQLRTKAALAEAIDQIGVLSADALAVDH